MPKLKFILKSVEALINLKKFSTYVLKMSSDEGSLKDLFYFGNMVGKAILPAVIPWFVYYMFFKKKNFAELSGKVVLITGASSGLGEQLAHSYFRRGAKLILASRRMDELERVKHDLLALDIAGREMFTPELLQLDLADMNGIGKRANEALSIHGRIDVLINNAGISYRGEIVSTDVDVDMRLMRVNYFGTIALIKAILPSMITNKSGQIISVGSVQGRIGIPFRSAYGASKHALQSFMDCLRSEVEKYGISVTVANPGYINTSLSVNAVTGSGDLYGVSDETTRGGYDAGFVAEKICQSAARGEKEVTIAPLAPRVAILLRALSPSLFFLIMARRAMKT